VTAWDAFLALPSEMVAARAWVADEPGCWETYGDLNHGDPWQEQRHWGD
jgi:hypothetical protein